MKKVVAAILVIFALIFWKLYRDKQEKFESELASLQQKEARFEEYQKMIQREHEANGVKEIDADKPVGIAGAAVREFFREWKAGRHENMRAMLSDPPPDPTRFAERLRRATLNWRRMRIIGEKQDGDAWLVSFSVEVTSPESALAAAAIDEMVAFRNLKGALTGHELTPLVLGIEKFKRYALEWRVSKGEDGKMRVQAYPGKAKKGIVLLSYVMNDTVRMMREIGMFQDYGRMPDIQSQIQTVMAFWMIYASLELCLEKEQSEAVIAASAPLIGKGRRNLETINDGVVAMLKMGKTPKIPK